MSKSSGSRKRAALRAGVILTLALSALVIWASFHPQALDSAKTITVNVTHANGTAYSRELKTTARTLTEALAPYELLETLRTDNGLFLASVDGESADAENGIYWVCAANSAELVSDAEARSIADGDVYDFYTIAY